MIPLRDHNPSRRLPVVTVALIAINCIVFLGYGFRLSDPQVSFAVFGEYGLIPARLWYGEGFHTFLTSMFLHGGWLHLIGNMLFLWIFGDNLEDLFGHFGFLAFYLLAGLAAALAQFAAGPFSPVPMVGASGAIAGVMGGYLLLFPRARVDVLFIIIIFFRVVALPAWLVLTVWFGLQVWSGVSTPGTGGGVAYWAHAGGFVAGLALAYRPWQRRGAQAYWRRTEGHPDHRPSRANSRLSTVPRVRRR
ncbi:rhomboid family intramembrane serine protease [Algicella marina]|uniref:Rhomboid family intramembrane serine protease n=1 Tax=Algicella marina TaxID=2683284 RepID=A0A6P1T3P2_9RHOB|nr:rhomboid family intramembrane serine protease [Algicella marina]QHQ36371.1 rhomboid family intramembrane serine protease [Algicella marina]